MEYDILKIVILRLCAHYKTPDSWGAPPAVLLSLCWEKLEEACQLFNPATVPLDEMHKWCSDNQRAVRNLAAVYSQFSERCGFTLLEGVPDVVRQSKDDHMKQYFQWVHTTQMRICSWQQKIRANEWTEAEVKEYAKVITCMNEISTDLHIETLDEDVECMQKNIHALKQVVKNALIPVHVSGR